jgi:hypothetical protein
MIADEMFARSVAMWSLLEASENASEEIRAEAFAARERAAMVPKSPLFQVSTTPRRSLGVLKEATSSYEEKEIL